MFSSWSSAVTKYQLPLGIDWRPPAQQPTCTNLRIRSVDDAHKIFYAIRCNMLHMVSRRLDSDERAALQTGNVYAWEERSPNTEITGFGIERWTDSRRWGPSRVRDEFRFYHERDPDHAVESDPPVGLEPLVKQTYSAWIETERGRRKWHLMAYFTQSTVDLLGTVDDIADVRRLEVPQGLFTGARIANRNQDPFQSTVAHVNYPLEQLPLFSIGPPREKLRIASKLPTPSAVGPFAS
ncbi:Gti1/Pac2 family-domain-containing protein [Mycena alexandri]|uniref:Gti1/Pac2 family-domain-containing protein n=1 Tax=Mycena alexandri TaxID=1745969 RepID=A0AAD6S4K7_9AGAR|nr:Gti1/Pac2 family-domain-containing protein [Mycena alexandri]